MSFRLPGGVRALLLDIEGTTTPRAFVFDILFPFARAHLDEWLNTPVPSQRALLERLHDEHRNDRTRGEHAPPWSGDAYDRPSAAAYLAWLMDRDRKSPALKAIQGEIWDRGYDDARLRGEVFADVPGALARWTAGGLRVYIFSSGSVRAQRRLFETTGAGDLTSFISGYFDTAIGSKADAESYRAIAHALPLEPEALVFFSDVTAELDAARLAGLETVFVHRPGNPPAPGHGYPTVTSFDGIGV
jgi:enolase-phosphatase E1